MESTNDLGNLGVSVSTRFILVPVQVPDKFGTMRQAWQPRDLGGLTGVPVVDIKEAQEQCDRLNDLAHLLPSTLPEIDKMVEAVDKLGEVVEFLFKLQALLFGDREAHLEEIYEAIAELKEFKERQADLEDLYNTLDELNEFKERQIKIMEPRSHDSMRSAD